MDTLVSLKSLEDGHADALTAVFRHRIRVRYGNASHLEQASTVTSKGLVPDDAP